MDTLVLENYTHIPVRLITEELGSGSALYNDMKEVARNYKKYRDGCDFLTEGSNGDYTPSSVAFKKMANLINKEARFMFGKTPEVTIELLNKPKMSDADKEALSVYQGFVDTVLKVNGFGKNLIKAAKDCFIGKRIAIMLNFNPEDGVTVSFVPALNFVYELDEVNADTLKKFVAYIKTNSGAASIDQRIFKKKYVMENGACVVYETVYDGSGNIVEKETRIVTLFTYIPVVVILNDGLLGNPFGESEVELLEDYEALYSKIANADVDAERKGMNSITYAIDADPKTTKGLSTAPGAFWDIHSDPNSAMENMKAALGKLESSMSYSAPLKETLQRISTIMHDSVDSPDISLESMQGVITSGKALRAVYWALIVRCDEKMKAWAPGLEFICSTIIEGAKLYPEAARVHLEQSIPDGYEYRVHVDNLYPLPEEEVEEKTMDIMEVNAQTMSKKSYMMKWRGLTSDEADEELKQIALEKQLLEDSFSLPPFNVDETEPKPSGEENPEEKGEGENSTGRGAEEPEDVTE